MSLIGVAGHVDHGKSSLVTALTGIDPDRLAEEKARGMTIDLGFAWLTLPSGREASIVDVPGHEAFIKNMLAGVGSLDVALLVIAADEGVTYACGEHLRREKFAARVCVRLCEVACNLRNPPTCVALRSATPSRSAPGATRLLGACAMTHMEEEIHSMNDDYNRDQDQDMDRDTDLGAEGDKNQVKGNMRQATGKIQEGFGKLTGQDDVEAEGRAKQMQGKAQNLGGRAESGLDDMADKLSDKRDDL